MGKLVDIHNRLYRAKDAVEKAFQVIKSVLKIRPVRHRSEEKIKGHIVLCMLALLLERTLRTKLASLPPITSAPMALEVLGTCHLNLCQHQGTHQRFYTVTRPTPDQTAILRAINLERLGSDEELASSIHPRM